MAFMVPVAEQLTTEEAREYCEPEGGWTFPDDADNFTAGWYGRLSAPGYLDCTDWQGPHETYEAALAAIMEQYDVDEDGETVD